MKALSVEDLSRAVRMLATARTIDIYGVENSFTPAVDLLTKLTYLGLNCRMHTDAYLQQISAALGTLVAYGAALITARSTLAAGYKRVIESIALVTNAIPGMVLGVAYLFLFFGTSLQNTLLLMILCNVVHYFSTPYLMMKNSLSKMNAGWETTAMLMGDSWLKTILRVVTPNARSSLIEVFSYYFINSIVTISALIFIAGARTMVLTTMIKQLQCVNRFNEVFVLSLLILVTNLATKALFAWLAGRGNSRIFNKRKREGSNNEWEKSNCSGPVGCSVSVYAGRLRCRQRSQRQ